jgi:hypothetical protein
MWRRYRGLVASVLLGLATLSCGDDSPTAVPHSHKVTLQDGAFTVSAAAFSLLQVNVSGGMQSARVNGSFVARGVTTNDIIVLVMSEMNAINWYNGNAYTALYESGQTTTASFNVNLGAGKFYVIFDNRFSTTEDKEVAAHLELVWTQSQ